MSAFPQEMQGQVLSATEKSQANKIGGSSFHADDSRSLYTREVVLFGYFELKKIENHKTLTVFNTNF